MSERFDPEHEAERLYIAIIATIKEVGIGALLTAGSDAKNKTPYDRAAPATRDVFRKLAVNLTAQAPKA